MQFISLPSHSGATLAEYFWPGPTWVTLSIFGANGDPLGA